VVEGCPTLDWGTPLRHALGARHLPLQGRI
jgi:hypothetical protein